MDYARALRHWPRVARTRIEREGRIAPEAEIVYRELFLRDLARAGIEDEFHPVGSAANHGLLYLITRCVLELPVCRVLELGAGQTSVLLDRLAARVGRPCHITTVEHDPYWAREIGARVSHPVIRVPLTPRGFYDLDDAFDPEAPAPDFVIVDGPPAGTAATRDSRLGAAAWLAGMLAKEFVVVFDDTERAAEARMVGRFRRLMTDRGDAPFEGAVLAAKQQRIACSHGFRAAAYF